MAAFPTTRWSLILASERSPGQVASAWGELVRDYRPAILSYFRRSALSRDAEDLTQEFLLKSMSEGWWSRADVEVGSFRRYLLMLLKRFLLNERDSGQRRFETSQDEFADQVGGRSPELQFDIEFALCLTRAALESVRAEYVNNGRSELFDALQAWLADAPEHGELATLGARLHVAPNTLAVQLKRLRLRFQKATHTAMRELALDAQHADADLAELRDALAAAE